MTKKTKGLSAPVSASPQTSEGKEDVGLETPTTEQSKTRSGQAMSPEAQRIAIAEACGWKRDKKMFNTWVNPSCPNSMFPEYPPAYLSDLNAIHEAEKVLTEDQWELYLRHISKVVGGWAYGQNGQDKQFNPIHATAAQRAEAFLKTLNLWEPDQSPDFQKHQG